MYEKTCRCGKSKKNFKMDIGPFFINKCCKEAGYDHNGDLKAEAPKPAPSADVNKDGKVDEKDLSIVHKAFAKVGKKKKTKKKATRKKKASKKAEPKQED